MEATEVVDILNLALLQSADPRINDITLDGDHKSAEVILTTDDGTEKQCWVLSSKTIVQTDPPNDE